MEKLKENNIIKAIGIAVIYWVIYKIVGNAINSTITSDNTYFLQVIIYFIMLLFLYIVLKLVKKTEILKEKGNGIKYGMQVGRFMFVLSIIVLISSLITGIGNEEANFSLSRSFWFILSVIGTGLTEEILCRGINQNIICDQLGRKSRQTIIKGILISSVIFGALHLGNIFAGVSIKGAIVQAIYSIFIGFYFGAIYTRTKNIWSVSLLHALLDCSSLIDAGVFGLSTTTEIMSGGSLPTVLFSLIYLFLGLYILRDKKADEFVEIE